MAGRRARWKAKSTSTWWADGIHANIRLGDYRQCILVLMEPQKMALKELIAMTDGHRESARSWREACRPRATDV